MSPRGHWFGPEGRPLCGWWSEPPRGSRHGVVVLGSIGYEYWSAHRTVRTLAERLAERGHYVLRFDYDGTGDSAGEPWDSDRVAQWRASVVAAVAELRARGVEHVTLVGLRFGGSLALALGADVKADRVVAWAPVISGKRFAREIKMLALPVPGRENVTAFAGTVFTPETSSALGKVELEKLAQRPADKVLVVAASGIEKLAAHLTELGSETETCAIEGSRTALEVPAEDAVVPVAIVDHIAAWVGDAPEASPLPLTIRSEARLGDVTESFVDLAGLAGIETRHSSSAETAVVFLNSGSEVHIGPGGAWVEYARALAGRDMAVFRVDWSGWGESPDRGHAPGRPYDQHAVAETVEIVGAVRARGFARVLLAGLCAGAWMAVQAALRTEVDGVIAINPQLYWNVGDPVEALIADTRKRRLPIRERDERLRQYHVWSALDLVGVRPPAARWLNGLTRSKTPSLMLFAAGDDGLEYLETRVARRLRQELRAGFVRIEQIADIDHQMYWLWRRPNVIAAMRQFVGALAKN